MNSSTLNLLGCYPEGLEILLEIASINNKYEVFHIFENVSPSSEIESHLMPGRKVVQHHIESDTVNKEMLHSIPLCFGVVGIESKPLVYTYFKDKYNIDITNFIRLIHPSCVIAASAALDTGITIEALCTISIYAQIGFGVTIKRNCSVGHHTIIDSFATLNPGVVLSGKVHIGAATMLGTGAVVKDGIHIGANSIIGVGSVVVKDIPSNVVAFGNPCKVIRKRQTNV